jgi:DEAD/DEAH box helicase domain-containing protein
MIAQADALDQYFIRHPEDFFGRAFETAVVDPDNAPILKAHLTCAAAELPLQTSDAFFNTERHQRELKELEKEGRLLLSASGREWISSKKNPHREVNIRSIGEAFTILTAGKGEIVGTLDRIRAFKECHPGAIYLHKAESFLVTKLDLFERNVYVAKKEVNFYTRIVAQKETEIVEKEMVRPVGNFLLNFGKVLVTETFTGYEKRAIHGQELLGTYPLELPSQTFETEGLWIEIEDVIQEQMRAQNFHIMGGLHALEHGAITIFPLFALCDRGDVGGICYPRHPQVGRGAIFIYDGYPGGVGLARRGYEIIENLLEKTVQLIAECPCEEGCPSCIHSPQCGSGNKPLDKRAALYLARVLLAKTPLKPKAEAAPAGEEGRSPAASEPSASKPVRLGFFDLETQRLAEEVGGWGNKHLMRLSVGVVYDSRDGRFHEYREESVSQLVEHLKQFDLLVGFNIKDFDFQVLRAYTAFNFGSLPTLDLLEDVFECLGFRLSLDHIVHKTLGAQKSGNGLQAVQWFREGNWEELTAYCRKDVELTRQVFEYGREKGYLLFESKGAQMVRCPVDWGLERIQRLVKQS